MIKQPARLYTIFAGIFLLLQGSSTLAFRLHPPLDQIFPPLLAITHMIPAHSLLHIVTGILALAILFWGGEYGSYMFAAGFGLFYIGLAVVGLLARHPTIFGLQPFDHSFHFLLGGLGLLAVGLNLYQRNRGRSAS
jgi:hypothetical protein